LVVPKNVPTF